MLSFNAQQVSYMGPPVQPGWAFARCNLPASGRQLEFICLCMLQMADTNIYRQEYNFLSFNGDRAGWGGRNRFGTRNSLRIMQFMMSQ